MTTNIGKLYYGWSHTGLEYDYPSWSWFSPATETRVVVQVVTSAQELPAYFQTKYPGATQVLVQADTEIKLVSLPGSVRDVYGGGAPIKDIYFDTSTDLPPDQEIHFTFPSESLVQQNKLGSLDLGIHNFGIID